MTEREGRQVNERVPWGDFHEKYFEAVWQKGGGGRRRLQYKLKGIKGTVLGK